MDVGRGCGRACPQYRQGRVGKAGRCAHVGARSLYWWQKYECHDENCRMII